MYTRLHACVLLLPTDFYSYTTAAQWLFKKLHSFLSCQLGDRTIIASRYPNCCRHRWIPLQCYQISPRAQANPILLPVVVRVVSGY